MNASNVVPAAVVSANQAAAEKIAKNRAANTRKPRQSDKPVSNTLIDTVRREIDVAITEQGKAGIKAQAVAYHVLQMINSEELQSRLFLVPQGASEAYNKARTGIVNDILGKAPSFTKTTGFNNSIGNTKMTYAARAQLLRRACGIAWSVYAICDTIEFDPSRGFKVPAIALCPTGAELIDRQADAVFLDGEKTSNVHYMIETKDDTTYRSVRASEAQLMRMAGFKAKRDQSESGSSGKELIKSLDAVINGLAGKSASDLSANLSKKCQEALAILVSVYGDNTVDIVTKYMKQA